MPLLRDVQAFFTRRHRPVEIDLTGTQAEGLRAALEAREPPFEPVEDAPLPGRLAADHGPRHEEVTSMVRKIGDHLDDHTQRTDRLLQLMDRLPQALTALPEINRQNAALIETLHEHLSHARRGGESLNTTLGRLTDTSDRQTEVLGLLQQQLDAGGAMTGRLNETLGLLNGALSDLARSNTDASAVLSRISDEAHRRDALLTATLERSQRWMIVAIICCAATSVMAIAVAIISMMP